MILLQHSIPIAHSPSPFLSNLSLANWISSSTQSCHVLYQFSYNVLSIWSHTTNNGYTKTHAYVRSVSFNVILYGDIIIPFKVQTQPSKSWVFKSHFSFKVRQQQFHLQYKTLPFSSTQHVLQPPQQYPPPVISFSPLAIFHATILSSDVLPKPSLQSLPTLCSSILSQFSTLYLFIRPFLQSPSKILLANLDCDKC